MHPRARRVPTALPAPTAPPAPPAPSASKLQKTAVRASHAPRERRIPIRTRRQRALRAPPASTALSVRRRASRARPVSTTTTRTQPPGMVPTLITPCPVRRTAQQAKASQALVGTNLGGHQVCWMSPGHLLCRAIDAMQHVCRGLCRLGFQPKHAVWRVQHGHIRKGRRSALRAVCSGVRRHRLGRRHYMPNLHTGPLRGPGADGMQQLYDGDGGRRLERRHALCAVPGRDIFVCTGTAMHPVRGRQERSGQERHHALRLMLAGHDLCGRGGELRAVCSGVRRHRLGRRHYMPNLHTGPLRGPGADGMQQLYDGDGGRRLERRHALCAVPGRDIFVCTGTAMHPVRGRQERSGQERHHALRLMLAGHGLCGRRSAVRAVCSGFRRRRLASKHPVCTVYGGAVRPRRQHQLHQLHCWQPIRLLNSQEHAAFSFAHGRQCFYVAARAVQYVCARVIPHRCPMRPGNLDGDVNPGTPCVVCDVNRFSGASAVVCGQCAAGQRPNDARTAWAPRLPQPD